MTYAQFFFILFTALNSIHFLNTQFVAKPISTNDLKAVLKHSLELKCEYQGSDNSGQFTEWYKDNVRVSDEKPGHYVVKNKDKESILIIKIFVKADADVRRWTVKTAKPGYEEAAACLFGSIPLKSSPQSIHTDRPLERLDATHGSVRRNEGESVSIRCLVDPPETSTRNILEWQFSKDDETFSALPDGVIQKGDELIIEQIKKADRGYYRCELNDVKFTVLLRVKDRLAALWPFIGIVSVVIALVIVILIFEKRQKSNKKTITTDDDDQDQANDPLVRTTIKGSDNDSKKRAVKA